ncbi:MAG TPA: hypothetical protein VJ974_01140 [Geopsychrobacteraceae bacterium]|nr:hypothetical protein [Geopsychrobacteraceae bacterium]
MKKQMMILMMTAVLMVPVSVMAMDHSKKESMGHDMKDMEHGKKMDHGSMEMDHGSMGMDGEMIMLQSEEIEGVKASAHLMDVKEKMAEHGMSQTHHIMVRFMDKEGNPLEEGSAAVKIEGPDEKISNPIKMMGMDGHFGVDITLDQEGMYHFKVGTKLADGQKRTFHFHYEN